MNDNKQPISTAPKTGRFVAIGKENGKYRRRWTWWGKASHIGWHGWCWMPRRDVENVDTWFPTHWLQYSLEQGRLPSRKGL